MMGTSSGHNRGGAVRDVRSWLRAHPRPKAIRVDGAKIVTITNRPNKWADAHQAIETLGATKLEALDGQGNVLRATDLESDVDPIADAPSQKEAWPESEAAQMAIIITAACDRAASRHENAYRIGFDRLAGLVETLALRLAGIEEAYGTELARRVALEAEVLRANGDNGPDALATTVIEGAMARMMRVGPEVGPKKPAKPNGEGT